MGILILFSILCASQAPAVKAQQAPPLPRAINHPLSTCTQDNYELGVNGNLTGDDSFGVATTLADGVTQNDHTICPNTDQDFYKFVLTTTSSVPIETWSPNPLDPALLYDSEMWLYDGSMNQIDYNDDKDGGTHWSYIQRCGTTALPAGTYYVKVTSYLQATEIPAYQITFDVNTGCIPNTQVSIGGTAETNAFLNIGQSMRTSYPSLANGPVQISSLSGTMLLIGAKRSVWVQNGTYSSYSEMLGLPDGQVSSDYYFPWYNNTVPSLLQEQLFITSIDNGTTVEISAAGSVLDTHVVNQGQTYMPTYDVDSGPLRVRSLDGSRLVVSLKAMWLKAGQYSSYSELMGLPAQRLSTDYYFPWYNDSVPTLLDEQLRFGNVDTLATNIEVSAGGTVLGTYLLQPGQSMRQAYPGVDNGPIRVRSLESRKIIAAIRAVWLNGGVFSSYNEVMGLPKEALATEYWLPWYNNTVPTLLDEQLRFGNVDTTSTTIEVTIGNTLVGSYTLDPGQSIRQAYVVDNGPVNVRSTNDKKIIVAMRAVWLKNAVYNSYSELMGLPGPLLSTMYWFPWYNNASATLDEQMRFGRP